MKTIFCICGRTASGKDTISDSVSQIVGIPKVISFTTRPRRDGETDDKHIFISQQQYEAMKESETLCAYTQIGEYHYFTTRSQIEAMLEENSAILYIIDPNGIKTLKDSMPEAKIITIFINVPREICKSRSEKRGDGLRQYHDRALDEHSQFSEMIRNASFDYAIPNHDLNIAIDIISHIIYRETK